MEAFTVIQLAEQAGCELTADGEHTLIKYGKRLPDSLKSSIKDHKQDILAVLLKDEKAKAAGLMIGIPGVLYTVTISNVSSVYIERVDGKWEEWRETHYPGQKQPISTKVIANS
ncbi:MULTISPECIES: hypothetical protein [Bacillus]|uniref:hypothetical protein n=1 Tax=Bacillus TaxID=1386 RepID=UPI0013DDCD8A|nr:MULTISPECIES: hypothetical protein [Bacillus]MDJ0288212.1 hypothetical protein [Bacillus altitudinis]